MQQVIEFSLRHWELLLAFFATVILFIAVELRNRFTGFPQLSSQEVTRLINREDAQVLDIRDSTSFDKGHIVGSLNIAAADIETKTDKLKKYKTKPLVIVFSVGQPAVKIATLLQKQGFEDISLLKGGIVSWQNASLPLVKD